MEYEELLLEKKGHVAVITLNNPKKLNALDKKMSQSLAQVTSDIALDDEIRVVIITGAGRGFCSGVDVSLLANPSLKTESRFQRIQVTGYPHADVFPKLNKPVIAAVNGPCAGGGFSLALSCDIRIAADTARFIISQVARGIVPDYGMTLYLPLIVGVARASEMIYTGEILDAKKAKELDIVSQVVPGEQLMPAAMELANKIARQPPFSLELSKKLIWRGLLDNLNRQLDLESLAVRICKDTEDHRNSVKAFLNKQPPPEFKGK
ncbi:MAG: enoyl-CoA hydratase/isomerase family protein [Dehalococcoidales bacterium]|nr:enoyl-CoA hydratase/isomerase family protein [Dehalococcoidales bacterium]